jgi:hypothetical protein
MRWLSKIPKGSAAMKHQRHGGNWAVLVPHTITHDGSTYVNRLRVIQTPLFSIYLHKIHRADAFPYGHDHPWWFAALIVSGGYDEEIWDDPRRPVSYTRKRRRWSLRTIKRSQAHRITDVYGDLWSAVVTGPKRGTWRFYPGYVPVQWRQHLDALGIAHADDNQGSHVSGLEDAVLWG